VVVSAVALYWVMRSIDAAKLADALSWRIAAFLVPTFLVYGGLTLSLEALSILRLVRSAAPDFRLWTAAKIKSASYLLAIVNYTLGAAGLTVLLRRRAGIGLGRAASVVLVIGSVDLLILLTVATLALTVAVSANFGNDTRIALGVLAAVGGAGFFGGMALLRAPMPLGPLERLRSLAVLEALRTTPLRELAELALLRTIFVSSFMLLGLASFRAFEIPVPVSELAVGLIVVGVISALPIAVAGLGTTQVLIVEYFGAHAPDETLFALSLVLNAGMILLRVGIGVLFAREFTREALKGARAEPG
jgi:hypothetical protein